jgi:hypothetical protein
MQKFCYNCIVAKRIYIPCFFFFLLHLYFYNFVRPAYSSKCGKKIVAQYQTIYLVEDQNNCTGTSGHTCTLVQHRSIVANN